jgi:hypothetical protein
MTTGPERCGPPMGPYYMSSGVSISGRCHRREQAPLTLWREWYELNRYSAWLEILSRAAEMLSC